jgi:hypothetical protein
VVAVEHTRPPVRGELSELAVRVAAATLEPLGQAVQVQRVQQTPAVVVAGEHTALVGHLLLVAQAVPVE